MKTISITAVVLAIGFVVSQFSIPQAKAASYSTKVECLGIPITISASVPSSVSAGAAFSVTNVTSSTTVPANITITKIVSNSNIINASPSLITGIWTGSGKNTFTANYPNVGLTATGAVGSKVTLSLNTIVVTVNNADLTCSTSANSLTATGPGESLTLFSIGITSPPTSNSAKSTSAATTTGSTTTSTSSQPKSTQTNPSTQSTQNPSTTSAASVSNNSENINIQVLDADGKPQAGAEVILDSGKYIKTNNLGKAIFQNIPNGSHKLSISYGDKTVSRTIVTSPNQSTLSYTIQLPKSAASGLKMYSMIAVLLFVFTIVIGLYTWKRRHRTYNSTSLPDSTAYVNSPIPSNASSFVQPQSFTPNTVSPTTAPNNANFASQPLSSPPTQTPSIPTPQAVPNFLAPTSRTISHQQPGQVIKPNTSV